MPKCNDCGNTYKFVFTFRSTDMLYFDESGEVFDTKNIYEEEMDEPRRCGECDSTNVEFGEETI